MMKKIIMLAVVLALSGCAVQKQMIAMGGSKADGTIKMGYSYGMFEVPKVDMTQAAALAAQKCKIWGYESAEPFGGQISNCSRPTSSGCAQTDVYIEYQCIGSKTAQN